MLVRGIEANEDDDDGEGDDEAEGKKEPVFTAEQVSSLRHIIADKKRSKAIDAGVNFASCGQAGDGCMMFNTQSGNTVIYGTLGEVTYYRLHPFTLPSSNDIIFITHAINFNPTRSQKPRGRKG